MPEEKEKDKSKIKVEVIKEEPPKVEDREKEEKDAFYFTEEKEAEEKKEEKEEERTEPQKIAVNREKTPFFILFLVFLFGLVIGAGLIGGIFYYKMKMEGLPKTASVKETPKAEEKKEESTPAPTPTQVSLAELKVLILNGSGIKGEAKRVEDLIKKDGFEKTETGNADSYNYTDTVVYLKDNVDGSVYEKLGKILSDLSLKKDVLEKDSPYDIKIIIGKTRK